MGCKNYGPLQYMHTHLYSTEVRVGTKPGPLDSGLDYGLDYGLDFGLDFGQQIVL